MGNVGGLQGENTHLLRSFVNILVIRAVTCTLFAAGLIPQSWWVFKPSPLKRNDLNRGAVNIHTLCLMMNVYKQSPLLCFSPLSDWMENHYFKHEVMMLLQHWASRVPLSPVTLQYQISVVATYFWGEGDDEKMKRWVKDWKVWQMTATDMKFLINFPFAQTEIISLVKFETDRQGNSGI